MKGKHQPQSLMPLYMLLLTFFCLAGTGPTYGMVNEIEYSTSLLEATGIVRVVVALFGGVIGVLGIVVAVRGVGGTADVTMSVAEHGKLSMKRVSQGVVITLTGAAILVTALYLLPEKRTERQIEGNKIIIERNSGNETIHLEQRTLD